MSQWDALYEEGYVSLSGERITVRRTLSREHKWASPTEAIADWKQRVELQGDDVQPYENGLEQVVQVGASAEFSSLGVISIWRRTTFVEREA